ncbi:hypothetical protein J6590_015145 [Homalodisca vitripennis]|nr:hypothetical protein J6590_015145 [Homalodisca vitripennis]
MDSQPEVTNADTVTRGDVRKAWDQERHISHCTLCSNFDTCVLELYLLRSRAQKHTSDKGCLNRTRLKSAFTLTEATKASKVRARRWVLIRPRPDT